VPPSQKPVFQSGAASRMKNAGPIWRRANGTIINALKKDALYQAAKEFASVA